MANRPMSMAPFWISIYWLFFSSGRWYQGILTDLVDRDILECKFVDDLKVYGTLHLNILSILAYIPSRRMGVYRRIGAICGGRFPSVIHLEALQVTSRAGNVELLAESLKYYKCSGVNC